MCDDVDRYGKWDALLGALRMEPAIDAERLTANKLAGLYHGKCAVMRHTMEKYSVWRIYGFAAFGTTASPEWGELRSVWVAPAERGKGLFHEMWEELSALPKMPDNLFALSTSQHFVHAACRRGFRVIDPLEPGFDVTAWATKLGVLDRLPIMFGGKVDKPDRQLLLRS